MSNQFKPGDKVLVQDHSEAHGDIGIVQWIQKDGLVIVELGQGCCWPVELDEIVLHEDAKPTT